MKTILISLWGFYLGGALSAFAHINWDNWRLYAIIIPTIILVEVSRQVQKED